MGWQKKGRTILQLVMGLPWVLLLEKLLVTPPDARHVEYKAIKKLTGKDKRHDCRKSHSGSSKSTERDVACGVKLLNLESNFLFMLGMIIPQH